MFNNWGVPLPGYEVIGDDPRRMIYAAATTKLRGDPWSPGGDALESLVSDILQVLENELVQNRYPLAQKVRAWFQAQHEALILLGVRIGRTARVLWKPEYAIGIFFELGILATERALSDLAKEYSSERVAIQHWSIAYERLVHVLGVSVTAALGLGGVLGRLIVDDEEEGDGASVPVEDVADSSQDEQAEDWVDEPAPLGIFEKEKVDGEYRTGDQEQEDNNEDADADAEDMHPSDGLDEDEANSEEDKDSSEEWDDGDESEVAPGAEDDDIENDASGGDEDDSEDDASGEYVATGNSSKDDGKDEAHDYEDNDDEDKDGSEDEGDEYE